ncbi:TIGR01548 family HAD-type hydrolase [Halobacteriales archaeon SW_7_68_16]|nr:MAG: TIGR01548 family HAD-type hydrolase [Halobacteriales archaeon SW_7_68_16]
MRTDHDTELIAADAVVFDIDGVLIDTSESYRRAIVETVDRVHRRTIRRVDVLAFKRAGGFNDDWAVTTAVARYVVATTEGYAEPPAEFADRIAEAGGGLDGARTVLRSALSARARQRVENAVDADGLRDVFQALYLGTDAYERLEGGEPPVDAPGFLHDEPVVIDAATVEALDGYGCGVLTGRPTAEADIALARTPLVVPREHRVTRDDPFPGKPDPAGLVALADRLDATRVAYADAGATLVLPDVTALPARLAD